MIKRMIFLAAITAAGSVEAQMAQFTYEMRDNDGETVVTMSEKDEGFKITYFDPDLIEVKARDWKIRWAGRFENEASPENLAMNRNNTFVIFTHPELGDMSCNAYDEEDEPNSWTRNINREALKAGFLNFKIGSCSDPLGNSMDLPSMPYKVQATYMLEK